LYVNYDRENFYVNQCTKTGVMP